MTTTDFFDAPKIEYKGPTSQDPLSFRHYHANEIILGKPMKEWLKFSVCFWHTLVGGGGSDPFGDKTLQRPWEDSALDPLQMAKRRIDVLFEFLTKLGVEYYTFHDIDVAPTGNSLEEFQHNLAIIGDYLLEKQQQTGIQLLWGTQNLFTNPRYMNGAMTNPDVHVFCYAAAQIQTMMDLIHKLKGSHHVFWGGREGYQSLLNTDLKQECDHMAAMYRMALAYKQKKGYTAQFLIEPKPREPTKHQYDYDAQTTMAFLHEYGLSEHFQLNIEPNHTTLAGHSSEHDIAMASAYNMLGSIDCNTGDPILGWDVDLFPMNVQETAAIMGVVIQQGGLSGGLNFDAKVRRESVDPIDLFYAHIGSMDCYALGLRKAAAMHEQGVLQQMLQQRYLTWSEYMGQKIERGEATLEECAEYAKKKGEPALISGRQELYEVIRNQNLYPTN